MFLPQNQRGLFLGNGSYREEIHLFRSGVFKRFGNAFRRRARCQNVVDQNYAFLFDKCRISRFKRAFQVGKSFGSVKFRLMLGRF